MSEYYVYIILDPNKEGKFIYENNEFEYQPFYIGYGKNNRMENHLHKKEMNRHCHKSSTILSILESGNKPIFIKIKEGLTFEEANELEIHLIKLMGRADTNTGILTNHTDGGMGTKNKVITEETKQKISKSKMGILHTEESKQKISIAHTGKSLSEETKNKLSNINGGNKNPFYGKKHNLETLSTCKKVIQLDINTQEVIAKYPSYMEAERVTKISHIDAVCRGKRNSAGGFNWIYENQEKVIRENKKDSTPKMINQIDINTGDIINTFRSINNAEKITGIYHISNACSGKSKTAGGYYWKYIK